MPPDRTGPKTKPFKPQRPSAGASSSRAQPNTLPTSSRTTATATQSSWPAQSNTVDAEDTALEPPTERIPAELLTSLLHEFFVDDHTRISKGADRAVGKYMETFVREAIARAAYERSNAEANGGDGFLEVEDLEKLAPQLVLDF